MTMSRTLALPPRPRVSLVHVQTRSTGLVRPRHDSLLHGIVHRERPASSSGAPSARSGAAGYREGLLYSLEISDGEADALRGLMLIAVMVTGFSVLEIPQLDHEVRMKLTHLRDGLIDLVE